MKVEDVKKYVGKNVLLIIKPDIKVTTIIPEFDGESFTTYDKFGNPFDVDCSSISFITETDKRGDRKWLL